MIDCVSIANCHKFNFNLVVAQHKLRYREVIEKERWSSVYVMDDMEFDRYDNLATEYFVARNDQNQVVGVTRTYPTTIPYMLAEAFDYLFSKNLPSSPRIFEASRLVLDRSLLSKEERRPVVDQLIVGYMERGLQRQIDAYIGFMLPKIWESTFLRVGWDVLWLGQEIPLPETGDVVRAGLLPVTNEINNKIRKETGIAGKILNFGENGDNQTSGVARYSDTKPYQESKRAA